MPLAPAAVESAHAEPIGALSVFDVAEHALDGRAALTVDRAPTPGAQLWVHAFAGGQVTGHPASGRRGMTYLGALLSILPGRDEEFTQPCHLWTPPGLHVKHSGGRQPAVGWLHGSDLVCPASLSACRDTAGDLLYLRFTLSYRDIEELLAERRIEVSYETARRCGLKFGPR